MLVKPQHAIPLLALGIILLVPDVAVASPFGDATSKAQSLSTWVISSLGPIVLTFGGALTAFRWATGDPGGIRSGATWMVAGLFLFGLPTIITWMGG